MLSTVLIIVCFFCSTLSLMTVSHLPAHVRLHDHLLAKYRKTVRPNINATQVKVEPAVYSIIEVNEARESLCLAQWFEITWTDDFLTWEPSDYDGLTELRLLVSSVWVPDITIYQLLSIARHADSDDSFLTVRHNGTVFLSRAENVVIHCSFQVAMFPYDTQTCKLTYVAWAYPSNEMHLTPGRAREQYFQQSAEWELMEYGVKEELVDYGIGFWYEITYHLIIKRKPYYYVLTLTVPSFFITNLSIIGLFSPSSASQERTEKVSIGLTALLTMAVILMMVSDLMPKNATSFPKLGKYILFEMSVMGLSTCMAVFVMYLSSQAKFGRSVPTLFSICWFKGNDSDRTKKKKLKSESNSGESYDYTIVNHYNLSPASEHHTRPEYSVRNPVNLVVNSSNVHLQLYTQMLDCNQVLRNVQGSLSRHLHHNAQLQKIQHEWISLCYQLDVLFLVLALSANVYATYLFSND